MKKIFLLLTIFLASVPFFAQNLPDVYHESVKVSNGDVFDVSLGRIGWHQIEMNVQNNTSGALILKAKKTPLTNLPFGSINYFCFDNCYGQETDISPEVTILAGGNVLFTGDYEEAIGGSAIVSIRYDIFNSRNENEVIYFTVNYIESSYTSIDENSFDNSICFVKNREKSLLSYNFPSAGTRNIIVFDLLGNKIYNSRLINQSGNVDLPEMKQGIYMYVLKEAGKILKASKFIIQ
jgi:hypothetical protein